MEDVKERKQKLRKKVEDRIAALSGDQIRARSGEIENQLFEFANFVESETALFYFRTDDAVDTGAILDKTSRMSKKIVLPLFRPDNTIELWSIKNPETDLLKGRDLLEPDPDNCKPVTFDNIDIAIVPGLAFDEKGGRIGSGKGLYDRLLQKLPNTARKVALAFEEQIVSHVPMESHDKFVDIIITDKRIIYKI